MPLLPKRKTPFFISDTSANPQYKSGTRVFRGSGTDYSDRGMIIYIGSVPLERVVPLKAFVESLKINLQKEIEKVDLKSTQGVYDKEYSSELSYDLTLNIPAHSTNEAANNLAKIEELQRLIMPTSITKNSDKEIINGASKRTGVDTPLFVVWFRNLINNGSPFIKKTKTVDNFAFLLKIGFPCYIEEINYEPDMEAGFFEFSSGLYPRNIKLTLKLNYDSASLLNYTNRLTMGPFVSNGSFYKKDSSLFPFGVVVRGTSGFAERPDAISKRTQEMTQKTMNDISGFNNTSFVFVSLPIAENANTGPGAEVEETEKDSWYEKDDVQRTRYVVFPAFIDSYSRRNKVSVTTNAEKGSPIFKKLNIVNYSSLDYSFKVTIVSKDLAEAKKNCAKIQYLMRMFIKRDKATQTVPMENPDDSLNSQTAQELAIKVKEKEDRIRIYIPKKLERPESSGVPTDFSTMYQNSLPFLFESLDIDINFDSGFFEDGARIFPKEMSITMGISDTDQVYMSSIALSGSEPADGAYYLNKGTGNDFTEEEAQLFPFNKKTAKFKIMGE